VLRRAVSETADAFGVSWRTVRAALNLRHSDDEYARDRKQHGEKVNSIRVLPLLWAAPRGPRPTDAADIVVSDL